MILTSHGYNEDLNFVFVPADGNTARKLLDGGWAHPQELIRFRCLHHSRNEAVEAPSCSSSQPGGLAAEHVNGKGTGLCQLLRSDVLISKHGDTILFSR